MPELRNGVRIGLGKPVVVSHGTDEQETEDEDSDTAIEPEDESD